MTSMLCRTAVLALCLGAACGRTPEITEVRHDCSNLACRPTTTVSWTGSYGVSPLDFLIVVDDSVPAGPVQGALSQAMRGVADNIDRQLQESRWAMDIHVAIVPANLATNSTPRLWPESQACPQLDGDYLQTTEICGRASNFTGPLADLLDCASTHLDSSGQPSRPMATIRALLSPGGLGETTGFRRPSARFVLGIISATDDPDLATEAGRADYRNFLLGAVPDSDALELAIVAPADAQGLRRFADLVGAYPGYEDIADASWYWMAGLGEPAEYKLQNLCLDRPIVDLAAPGSPMQPLCFVIERDTSPDGATEERTLPMCEASGTPDAPCWRAVIDRTKCPVSGLYIPIARPGCRSPDRVKYQVTCAVEYEQVASSDLQGVPGKCGTADEPSTLIVTHRVPALGATVKNSDITEGFTMGYASMFTEAITLDATSPLHTAGYAMPAYILTPTPGDAGTPGRFDGTVGSWSVAPAHVELSATAGYRTEDGCYYQLPSPLLSYDVTP